MRIQVLAGALTLAMIAPAGAQAQQAGIVEGLQMPVWMERNGNREPVRPGMTLKTEDRLFTAGHGRLLMRLDEGSQVKLGGDAEFHVEEFTPPSEPEGAFRGLLNVVKGAFRFTTSLLSKRHKRDLSVRIATVTAGIRGTDLWGKANDDRDIVCLIEGRISVEHGNDDPIAMEDPLSFFIAPRDAPPLPVAPVSQEQLDEWSAQTELETGSGVLRIGGQWRVNLRSYRQHKLGEQALAHLHEAGYPADLTTVTVLGDTWHRLSLGGFPNRNEASAFSAVAADELGMPGAWLSGGGV